MRLPRRIALLLSFAALSSGGRSAELAWPELLTSGVPADMTSFYEKTLGWTSERAGKGDLDAVVFLRGGKPVAGIAHRAGERMAKPRARWVGFFAAKDLAAEGKAVVEAGGLGVEEKHAGAARTGAQALFADKEGTVFGLITESSEAARGVWPILLARRTGDAAEFLRKVFGGEIKDEPRTPLFRGDFRLCEQGKPWAGVQPTGVSGRPGWLLLFAVADIEAATKQAKREGGRVVREPKLDLIGGRVAVIEDPAGGVFGLYEAIPMKPSRGAEQGDFEVEAITR